MLLSVVDAGLWTDEHLSQNAVTGISILIDRKRNTIRNGRIVEKTMMQITDHLCINELNRDLVALDSFKF